MGLGERIPCLYPVGNLCLFGIRLTSVPVPRVYGDGPPSTGTEDGTGPVLE